MRKVTTAERQRRISQGLKLYWESRKMKVAIDIEPFERKLLAYLFAMYGNRTKSKIRHAWESGDYSEMRLGENDESTLQAMRNTRGPSWLVALKLSSL